MEVVAIRRERASAVSRRSLRPPPHRAAILCLVLLACLLPLTCARSQGIEEAPPAAPAGGAEADSTLQAAAPLPPIPAHVRGFEQSPPAQGKRAALLLPRFVLFPVRVATHIATVPVKTLAGALAPILPLDRIWYGLRRDRYFVPVLLVDPRLGANAGFRAAHGNPLHGGGAITYRAAYGGDDSQVFAITARSHDDRLTPYRSGWSYLVRAKYENTSRHPHFGFGNESSRDSLAYYNQERFLLRGTLRYAPWPWLRCDLTAAQYRTQIAHASDIADDETGLETRFPELITSPGPGVDPEKRCYEVALTFDHRNDRGRPTAGMWGEVYYGTARGAGDDTTRFNRYGLELQAYLPLARSHTLVLRLAGEEIQRSDGDSLHFTDFPSLGGRSTLRGFYEDRFVDYATLLGTLEYRLAFAPTAEVCLFMDLGEALPKLTDPLSPLRTNFEGMHYSWGGGLRYATRDAFCVRGFVAFSEEDVVLVATLESAFDREDRRERR